jgi:hypothetical protein
MQKHENEPGRLVGAVFAREASSRKIAEMLIKAVRMIQNMLRGLP